MNYYTDVLKKYAVFSGRARRKEYWMFVLFNIIIASLLLVLDSSLETGILNGLYSLAILIPSIAVGVRRLHDSGRTGWWYFIIFVPFIGAIVFLIFMVLDSKPGDNQYGPNPKGMMAVSQ